MNIKITGSGSYIPEIIQDNSKFLDREFFDNEGNRIETKNEEIIEKFQKITGIKERRYAKDGLNTSDLAYLAAKEAIENSNVDIIKEMMDMIMTQKGLELLGKAMQAGEQMLKAGMGMT